MTIEFYVPTDKELEIIREMRRDVEWAERRLNEARECLTRFESEIRKPKKEGVREQR